MPKKRKLASLDDKCRVCLSDDGCMSDIFSELLRPKITDLGKSASIPIDDDETFPRNICHVCLYKLDMWIDFKEQFVRSNAMLREHLELGELSDNKTSLAKRKHSETQECTKDDSVQQGNAKKLKSDSPTPADAGSNLKTEKQSESNEEQKAAVEDSQKAKDDSDMSSDVIPVASEAAQKVKQIAGRRAKTTERRKESTRRWVARKKALLAATGENDTDTDSMVSEDEQQLSPVQKARAKCNAEKVAAESHRRMTRAMQNLDSNISGYYGTNADSESYVIQDSDSEARNERTNCAIKTETPTDGGGDARLPSNSVSNARPNNSIAENSKNPANAADGFVPHSVRSELIIDGVTFVVTSTLVLSEPHYLNPAQTNNSSSLPGDEATQQERNTDIIDAVQLRRVSPKNVLSRSESRLIDTCLNIEVEGTELDSLQRVQSELAKFVEKGLRNKLVNDGEEDDEDGEKIEAKVNDAFQTLDQQLKTIVEKTIKKNLENSRTIDNRGNNTFTGEFLKAAVRSKIFQPRVHLVRYDAANPLRQKSRKTRKSNVLQEVAKSSPKVASKKVEKIEEPAPPPPPPPPPPLGKRRSVQPAKYADYNTSPFDSEGEEIAATSQVLKKPTPVTGPKFSKVKTYGPAAPKPAQTPPPAASQPKAQQSLLLPQKPSPTEKPAATNSTSEKHICGVCGDAFSTRKEVETHFGTHKKQKMMRCKRCHEIVDARLVKSHVCSASKNLHKCSNCAATFRTEQLLARHAESHELERETAARMEKTSDAEAKSVHETNDADSTKTREIAQNERSDLQLAAENRERESYTCFVCDKTFTDEELLKDHLQKHCDDMSEDERSSNAKEYQCAICGEALESEDALETHVEKHLFDDEDDNPNLISIGGVGDAEKTGGGASAETLHSCGQCSENFDSEMLLMLHMQAHEEEVAIAEWERRGIDNSQEEQHVCVICDDLFATEDDLSEHLDIHNGNAHICILCDKPFLTLEELQSHVNTH